jgi:hypothetical protein
MDCRKNLSAIIPTIKAIRFFKVISTLSQEIAGSTHQVPGIAFLRNPAL